MHMPPFSHRQVNTFTHKRQTHYTMYTNVKKLSEHTNPTIKLISTNAEDIKVATKKDMSFRNA